MQDWYNHFNPYFLFLTLPHTGGNKINIDPEWTQFWDQDDPRYEPLHQRLMLEFYRLQQLAHQKGLLRTNIATECYRNHRPSTSKAAEISSYQDRARST